MYLSASRFFYPVLTKMGPRLASSIQEQLNPEGSLYLAPELDAAEFHGRLSERHVASVLLPRFCNDGRLELLIADDDLDRIGDLITKWPNGHPIKLYSVTGGRREYRFNPPGVRPRAHYAVSLFPPHLADGLIGRSALDAAGARVLTPRDAFLACAYRAVYLETGCWECSGSGWIASVDCDVGLRAFAKDAGISLRSPVTPGELDELLNSHGWRPSLDLLERAAHWMAWIRDTLPATEEEEADEPGLTLFFLRQRAIEAGFQSRILDCLRQNGFDPLLVFELDAARAEAASKEFRGGNWGRGPYRVSGGRPAAICVALDLLPVKVDARHRGQFPDCDNRRIVDAKYAARDLVNDGVAKADHYNPVHSTDNTRQTWRAVRVIVPDQEAGLRAKIEELRSEFETGGAVRNLTKHGRRAKVELIHFEGGLAIRKTFRPSALNYMQREIEVMERLSPLRSEVPRLLGRGDNHIVIEYVGDGAMPPPKRRQDARPKPLPLRYVRQLAELIAISVSNGFDPVDLRADGNVIYGPSGLKLIDFEFWRRCDSSTPAEKSMCLAGIPADDSGEGPLARKRTLEPYAIGWYPYTLLSVTSFLNDPPWLQRVKRAANLAKSYARWALRQCSGLAKRGVRRGMRAIANAAVAVVAPRRAPASVAT